MIILLMLIPLSLMLLAFAIGAFVWAVRKGQFDDMDTPALDILHDDERAGDSPALKTREAIHGVGRHAD
ncbi:cbb3-type cytochrome oxidase assembly protein CcoS [Dyella japonica]|uniref:Cytochrome oxidase maturation protein Cbb3 n=1 Tax=Dyella japonica A8 TaxID=1217721 RepID=A0A075JZD9_9GAMM|nr:cbb3-type cytochrome oxidase assembly protein CcoS [Dyella japonica]AIF46877.1 cytochrome oxidase maturation protein Cbb3 [Dyella japonica A8]